MGCSVCFQYVDRLKRGVHSCIVREWLIPNNVKICCLVWPLLTAGWLGSHTDRCNIEWGIQTITIAKKQTGSTIRLKILDQLAGPAK